MEEFLTMFEKKMMPKFEEKTDDNTFFRNYR